MNKKIPLNHGKGKYIMGIYSLNPGICIMGVFRGWQRSARCHFLCAISIRG